MSASGTLTILLRVMGTSSLLGAIFVFVPHATMDSIHRSLGLGPMPDAPIVGYLARSTSAFYALLGGLLWVVSFDLQRHRAVLVYLSIAIVLFGATLLGIDVTHGLPRWWTVWEGPFVVAFGAVLGWLTLRGVKPPS